MSLASSKRVCEPAFSETGSAPQTCSDFIKNSLGVVIWAPDLRIILSELQPTLRTWSKLILKKTNGG
jgi:hypothetical protein